MGPLRIRDKVASGEKEPTMRGICLSLFSLGLMTLFGLAAGAQPDNIILNSARSIKPQTPPAGDLELRWKCSTQGTPWMDKPSVQVKDGTPVPDASRALFH